MTDNQKNLFIGIAQCGVCCGLYHPYEWLVNYIMHNLSDYDKDVEEKTNDAIECVMAFYRGAESYPNEWTISVSEFKERVNDWYNRNRKGEKWVML